MRPVSRSLRQSCSVKRRCSRVRGEPVLAYGSGSVCCLRDSGDNTSKSHDLKSWEEANNALTAGPVAG